MQEGPACSAFLEQRVVDASRLHQEVGELSTAPVSKAGKCASVCVCVCTGSTSVLACIKCLQWYLELELSQGERRGERRSNAGLLTHTFCSCCGNRAERLLSWITNIANCLFFSSYLK